MRMHRTLAMIAVLATVLLLSLSIGAAQDRFSIEKVLSAPFPSSLVSAKKADRIAWIEFERGMRNVYTAAGPGYKPKRLTDYMEDEGNDLTGLSISDDGSLVLFIRGHRPNRDGWVANPASNPDGSEQVAWAVKTKGGKPFRVVATGNPELSPDGNWALFVENGQIHQSPVVAGGRGGRSGGTPLFKTWGSNGNPEWSPDGKKIAFVSDRRDHSYIGIYDRQSRKITYLAPGVDRDTSPSWSSDSRNVTFLRRPGLPFARIVAPAQQQGFRRPVAGREQEDRQNRRPGLEDSKFAGGHTIEIWVAEVETGAGRKIWSSPADDEDFETIISIEWAGDNIVFLAERNNWRHYYSVSRSGRSEDPAINLTPGEGEVETAGFSSDGKTLYYSTNIGDIDRRHIWKVSTAGGSSTQLTQGEGIESYPAALSSGMSVAALYADARRPHSVAVIPSSGGEARIISRKLPGDFPLNQHLVPENVILTAEDGLKFHNQVFVPKDIKPGERRPAILFTHGGPGRQMFLGYHNRHFYHMAYGINQYFANQGYVVISVNYRAGIGYGREFRTAPERGSRGSSEYQDVYAAGKYLQSRPDVDPQRIGLWGLSYGGILTAMGLSRNSDIFAAGVDIAGIHLWGRSIDPESVSYKSSAVATIDKWTSPVLLIHGDDDRNVDFSQTTGLVQLLRAHGVPYELIVYPDEVHSFLVFRKWLKAFNATAEFFDRHLRNPATSRSLK